MPNLYEPPQSIVMEVRSPCFSPTYRGGSCLGLASPAEGGMSPIRRIQGEGQMGSPGGRSPGGRPRLRRSSFGSLSSVKSLDSLSWCASLPEPRCPSRRLDGDPARPPSPVLRAASTE